MGRGRRELGDDAFPAHPVGSSPVACDPHRSDLVASWMRSSCSSRQADDRLCVRILALSDCISTYATGLPFCLG